MYIYIQGRTYNIFYETFSFIFTRPMQCYYIVCNSKIINPTITKKLYSLYCCQIRLYYKKNCTLDISDMIILATSNNLASSIFFSYTIILYYVCFIKVKSNLRFFFFCIKHQVMELVFEAFLCSPFVQEITIWSFAEL